MKSITVKQIAFAGILAAVYTAVTLATASFAYGPVQFRIAEALTALVCFTPAAIPGMVIGCMAANLLGSFVSIWDFLIGSFATLLACLLTRKIKNAWLMPLPTILCNAIIVGAEIAVFFDERAFPTAYAMNALSVGFGEAVVMYVLAVPLFLWLKNSKKTGEALAMI